jgi:hypothetical protein
MNCYDKILPGINENNNNKRCETNINESDEFRRSRYTRPSSHRNSNKSNLEKDKKSYNYENFDKISKENNSPKIINNQNYRYPNNNLMIDYERQGKQMKMKLSKDKNNDYNNLFNKNNNLNLNNSNDSLNYYRRICIEYKQQIEALKIEINNLNELKYKNEL